MPSPEQDDPLEPPGVSTRWIVWSAVAALGALVLGLTTMGGFYMALGGHELRPKPHPFPAPVLETSIDPRTLAPVERGPKGPRQPPPRSLVKTGAV